jgi:hypothetical protein
MATMSAQPPGPAHFPNVSLSWSRIENRLRLHVKETFMAKQDIDPVLY